MISSPPVPLPSFEGRGDEGPSSERGGNEERLPLSSNEERGLGGEEDRPPRHASYPSAATAAIVVSTPSVSAITASSSPAKDSYAKGIGAISA